MTRLWALVPFKGIGDAKTRLAPVLAEQQRRDLALAMAKDVLSVLLRVPMIEQVVLVCSESNASDELCSEHIKLIDTSPGRGLNTDLRLAAHQAEKNGAEKILIAHADLPLLSSRSVKRFLRTAAVPPQGCAVRAACCKEGRGTNLLLAPLPLPIPLVYGADSCTRFRHEAVKSGIPFEDVADSGLANDIDGPDDFLALRALWQEGGLPPGATKEFFKDLPQLERRA